MAGVTGLEPAASGVTGRRSNQTELHPLSGNRTRVPYRVSRSQATARERNRWCLSPWMARIPSHRTSRAGDPRNVKIPGCAGIPPHTRPVSAPSSCPAPPSSWPDNVPVVSSFTKNTPSGQPTGNMRKNRSIRTLRTIRFMFSFPFVMPTRSGHQPVAARRGEHAKGHGFERPDAVNRAEGRVSWRRKIRRGVRGFGPLLSGLCSRSLHRHARTRSGHQPVAARRGLGTRRQRPPRGTASNDPTP